MTNRNSLLNSTTSLVAIAALVATVSAVPTPARADGGDVVKGIVGLAVICAVSGACGSKKDAGGRSNGGRSAKGGGAVSQDVALTTKEQRQEIQMALSDQGHYRSTIDGSFGKGTRTAIREWQAARGYPANGVLSGAQINELLMGTPRFASLAADDTLRLEYTVAEKLERNDLLLLQQELNALGYDAGVPDGVWGRKTRRAIAAYKADRGIGGEPVPSRLLLAHLTGDFGGFEGIAIAAGAPTLDGGYDGAGGLAKEDSVTYQGVAGEAAGIGPVEDDGEEAPAVEVASLESFQFDILSLQTGMARETVEGTLAEYLPADAMVDFGRAEQFNGKGALTLGHRMFSPNWPEPNAEEIVTLYDQDVLSNGAVAVLRSVRLPDNVTRDDYLRETVPALKAAYGTDALVSESGDGELIWVGDAASRKAILSGTMDVTDCGEVGLSPATDASLWEDGGGPMLAGGLAETVVPCGDVLAVSFGDGALEFKLWNSDVLANATLDPVLDDKVEESVVPKIKF